MGKSADEIRLLADRVEELEKGDWLQFEAGRVNKADFNDKLENLDGAIEDLETEKKEWEEDQQEEEEVEEDEEVEDLDEEDDE